MNGVDVSELYRRTFRLDSPQNVTAVKEFLQDVNITENIFIQGSVDGVDLDQEAVTLHTNQTIDGPIFFNSSLTVNGNMTVEGEMSALIFQLFWRS